MLVTSLLQRFCSKIKYQDINWCAYFPAFSSPLFHGRQGYLHFLELQNFPRNFCRAKRRSCQRVNVPSELIKEMVLDEEEYWGTRWEQESPNIKKCLGMASPESHWGSGSILGRHLQGQRLLEPLSKMGLGVVFWDSQTLREHAKP